MFIRCTQTRNRKSGAPYTTYRLVQSVRTAQGIKQTTLLNLGSHFDLPKDQWPLLAQRIDELVHNQSSLIETTSVRGSSDSGTALCGTADCAQTVSRNRSCGRWCDAASARTPRGD